MRRARVLDAARYMQGVEQAGGVPVMLPLTDDAAALRQLADTCDGFC